MLAERYAAGPPFPSDRSIVLKSPPADVERGLPPFVVAGVQTELASPRDWDGELRLFLGAGVRAIRDFNRTSETKITHVGVVADALLVSRLGAPAVVRAIAESFQGDGV